MLLRTGSRLNPTLFVGVVLLTSAVLFIIFLIQKNPPVKMPGTANDPLGSKIIFDELGSALFDILLLLVIVFLGKHQSEEDKKRTWFQKLINRDNTNASKSPKMESVLKTV